MDRPRRVVLLLTSPRVPPGLLSRDAWRVVQEVDTVLARTTAEPCAAALVAAGVDVGAVEAGPVRSLARDLVDRAEHAQVLWLGSSDGDPGLGEALAEILTGHPDPPELEMLVGSWDVPGARLLDAVAVMDRLRSPGGCPWDAEQTHTSLTPYLLEEAHEAVEALETGDREHMSEELGDVLLQVLFHARVAQEHDEDPFDVDDVAAGLVEKLVRRHPHVFAPAADSADTAAAVEASWEVLKAREKPERAHLLDGVPPGMPELARAAKVASRLDRAGQGDRLRELVDRRRGGPGAERVDGGPARGHAARGPTATDEHGVAASLAADLMDVVLRARDSGVDPSAALRALLRTLSQDLDR